MYFIAAGEVEIALEGERLRLGVGQFFGEVAVLRRARRSATATATHAHESARCSTRTDLHALMEREPRIADAHEGHGAKSASGEVARPRRYRDGAR